MHCSQFGISCMSLSSLVPPSFSFLPHFTPYLGQYLDCIFGKTTYSPKPVIFFLRNHSKFIWGETCDCWFSCFQFLNWPVRCSLAGCCQLGCCLCVMMLYPLGTDSAQLSFTPRRGRGRWMDGWINVSKGCAHPPCECLDGWANVWICGLIGGY